MLIGKSAIRCVLLIIAIGGLGVPTFAQSNNWSLLSTFGYTTYAEDDYLQGTGVNYVVSDRNGVIGDSLPDGSVNLFEVKQAEVGGESSTAQGDITARVGSFHLFSSATARTDRTEDPSLGFAGLKAQTSAGVSLDLTDQLTFKSKKPGAKLIKAGWLISGGVSAGAIGLVDPNGRGVFTQGESELQVSGTGMGGAPNFEFPSNSHFQGTQIPWAYSYKVNGGTSEPTIDNVEYDNPSYIPIQFAVIPGSPMSVSWDFTLQEYASVQDGDASDGGYGSGVGEYGHTINWGGITSVIDIDTGLPDTDWSVTSASGFDYSQAVPEPATSTIVLCALGMLAFRRKVQNAGVE